MQILDVFSTKATRAVLLCSVCSLVWMQPTVADARDLVPDKPSVEVNLGALRTLQPATYQPVTAAPVAAPAVKQAKGSKRPAYAASEAPSVVVAPVVAAPVIAPAPVVAQPAPVVAAKPVILTPAPVPAPAIILETAPRVVPAEQPHPVAALPVAALPVIAAAPVVPTPAPEVKRMKPVEQPAPNYVPPAPLAKPVAAVKPEPTKAAPLPEPTKAAALPTTKPGVPVLEQLAPLPEPSKPAATPAPQPVKAAISKEKPKLDKADTTAVWQSPQLQPVLPIPVEAKPENPGDKAAPVESVQQSSLSGVPPLPPAVFPARAAVPALPSPTAGALPLPPVVAAIATKPAAVTPPVPATKPAPALAAKPISEPLPLPPLPTPAATVKLPDAPAKTKDAAPVAAMKTGTPTISTAPMMVPVPKESTNGLPPSVNERMEKTFGGEPAKQGLVSDTKTVKDTLAETKRADAEKAMKAAIPNATVPTPMPTLPAVKSPLDAPPLPPMPLPAVPGGKVVTPAEPVKATEPVNKEATLPPIPTKPEAAVKMPALAAKPGDVVKKDAGLPSVDSLPPPLPPLPKPDAAKTIETSKPVAPPKFADMGKKDESALPPIGTIPPLPLPGGSDAKAPALPESVSAAKATVKPATDEKLPPASLPPVPPKKDVTADTAPQKPVVLPKTEIAAIPKMDSKASAPSALPDLPKPPVVAAVKKDGPAKKDSALPELPKLPSENTLTVPPKSTLPSLTAITGDKPPVSSIDVVQPKDSIATKPLAAGAATGSVPALPKFPTGDTIQTAKNDSAPPVMPVPPKVDKAAPAKPVETAAPTPASKVPAALPPLPPITAASGKGADLPALPLPAAKASSSAVAVAVPAAKDAASTKADAAPLPAASKSDSPSKLEKSIAFPPDKSDLSDDAKSGLTDIAEKVKKSQGSVRVVAYAAGTAEQEPVAKRTSLSRALRIRAFLIEKGVNQLSINVQALGNQVPNGDADRADVFTK